MIPQKRILLYASNKKFGVWWFRIFGYGLHLNAPWNQPLFSERNGNVKKIKFKGWRIGV